jgi:hypothetical protein
MRSTTHTPTLRFIAVLSVAALLVACGGGGASGASTDSAISLATVSSGHALTPIGTTPTTPVVTTPVVTTPTVVGAPLTDVRLESTGSAQTNMPFTFGQVFTAGALSIADGVAAKLADGTVLPLQIDVKATHADGSVRHAIISGVLPSLAAGQTQTLNLVKATPSAKSTVTLQGLLSAGLTGKTTISLNGVKYSASLADAVVQSTPITWLSGTVANEWIVSAPLKDANGVAHPQLTARFDVRWYSGLNKQARVEFMVENDKTWTPGIKVNYDVNLELNGQSVFTKTGMDHYHHSRWHQYVWWDAARQPAVNVKLNTAYLIATKAVPNYDTSFAPGEGQLNSLAQSINGGNIGPMTIGPVTAYMPTTGGRNDIGALPSWSVMWLLSMDKRAWNVMMAAADGAGSWSIHYRDEKTGRPVRTDNDANKEMTTHFNLRDRGPLPVPRFVNDDLGHSWTPYTDDTAHQPSLDYLPYLVTGDYYYLEELQFWAASNPLGTDPNNSGHGKGLVRWLQLRGQAWSLRTLGQVAYITPDADPMKDYFVKQLGNNLDFYNQTYVVGNPNKLGLYDGSGEGAFQINGTAPWQDDFFTWSFSNLVELGFTKAAPILNWKAKFVTGRMTDPGFCWIEASSYFFWFRDSPTSPAYDTFGQVYQRTFGEDLRNEDSQPVAPELGKRFVTLECAGQAQADLLTSINPGFGWEAGRMAGYADSVMGYPANMQPALAAAVDAGYPKAKQAWDLFMTRKNKPDYRNGPQFAIIPR